MACVRVFRPGVLDEEVLANQAEDIVVRVQDVREAIAGRKAREDLVRRLEEMTRAAAVPLPPLEMRDRNTDVERLVGELLGA